MSKPAFSPDLSSLSEEIQLNLVTGFRLLEQIVAVADRRQHISTLTHGFNTLELAPRNAGQIVELFTVVNNSRKSRLTYKVTLLDGAEFGRAWERSFAWEMMTYPVLTRKCHGVHQYLQGNNLRIRDDARTTKRALTPEQEYDFISQTLGIHPTIIKQAFAIVSVKN